MEKLVHASFVINGFIKVFRGICIGAAVACVLLTVPALIVPEEVITTADMSVDLGNITLYLARGLQPGGPLRLTICLMLLSGGALAALTAFGLHLVHKILLPMSEGRPFDGSVSRTLRCLGWLTLIGGVCVEALSSALTLLELRLYNIEELFSPGLVSGYRVEFDGVGLVAPVVLFLLSHIFRYGEELQRQSDETL